MTAKRRTGWPTGQRHNQRRGARRLPEKLRQKVLKEWPHCWLRIPGYCIDASTQCHHVVDAADGGTDTLDNLRGVCKPCHTRHSAQVSQRKSVAAAWDWKRKPEKHPGVLD